MTCVTAGGLVKLYSAVVLVAVLIQSSHEANFKLKRQRRQSCGVREFQCDSGQCIAQFSICDGVRDCEDGSDEISKTCLNVGCPSYAYRCAYGGCVNRDARCNGQQDCADGSDEAGCPGAPSTNVACKNHQFQCKSSTCIDVFLLCDGTKDCDDGSDETAVVCKAFSCPSYAFRCDYGACIDKSGVCNGVKQCADGSDEKPQRCGKTPTTPRPSTPPPTDGCKLPQQPENGQYKLGGCNPPACQPTPGNTVHTAFLSYTCNNGFVLSGSQILLCEKVWSSPFPTCSRVSCPPLAHPSREMDCKLNDMKVDCGKPMAPGTKAFVKCNNFYTHTKEFSDFDTVCGSDGKWSRDVIPCIPKCGEPNPEGLPFVAGGTEAKYGEYPWHVGIYRMLEGKYEQVCGGSIISERAIVTAAHCFWNVGTASPFDIGEFKIAVGKFFRNWDSKNERYVQYPEMDKVLLHSRFRGDQRQWQNDIALIKLKVSIVMTIAVRPVCVDYNREYERLFLPGKSGIVVGWGITETMQQSDTLHKATLPYVAFEDCEKEVPPTFLAFLTNDKFCAGYRNGTSVCPGDSGGGYATQFRDGKWYLMGLVSVGVPAPNADTCNIYQYTTFTKVSDYYPFVQENKSK